tara:strand:- start:301 stop:726 length:426 start_codon:yes stop_codon:yes gene_type:complete
MAINYSWQIEDMKWDNTSGMVVSVNAKYIGTYNGQVGSATTTITEYREKILLLNSSSSPIGINTLTPNDVKGWLNDEFASELPSIQKEISDVLSERKDEFLHEQHIVTYNSQNWKYYRPAHVNDIRNLPNSSWSGEPEVGK